MGVGRPSTFGRWQGRLWFHADVETGSALEACGGVPSSTSSDDVPSGVSSKTLRAILPRRSLKTCRAFGSFRSCKIYNTNQASTWFLSIRDKRCKPTSILTNITPLMELENMRMKDRTKNPLPEAVEDTIKESETWSKWAPGLVKAIVRAVGSCLDIVTAQVACRRLDTEGFKKHIQNHHVPFRRDCRQCLEAMGQSEPHRRPGLDGAAYCLSIDLAGPFPLGRDEGFNKRTKAKYILVGTVAIPKSWASTRGTEGRDAEGTRIQVLRITYQKEKSLWRLKLNERWMEKAKELSTTVGLQKVTMLEVLEMRRTKDVVPAVGRIYAKMKAYGIPIHRVHSDRERCFITDSFRDFCLNRSLYQTMTSGDTPQENGRVESEICQIKRRLRLMLAESKLAKCCQMGGSAAIPISGWNLGHPNETDDCAWNQGDG